MKVGSRFKLVEHCLISPIIFLYLTHCYVNRIPKPPTSRRSFYWLSCWIQRWYCWLQSHQPAPTMSPWGCIIIQTVTSYNSYLLTTLTNDFFLFTELLPTWAQSGRSFPDDKKCIREISQQPLNQDYWFNFSLPN